MPKFQIEMNDGRKFEVEADKQPTEEEVMSQLGEGSNASPSFFNGTNVPSNEEKSPLSVLDRAKLSFVADNPKDYENELKKRFTYVTKDQDGRYLAGNEPGKLQPIDPEGIIGDFFGELADQTKTAISLAGQIGGAMVGGASGATAGGVGAVPGAIAGGAIGSAGAEALSQGIAKKLGMSTKTPDEEAVDTILAGAYGAIGEGIGVGLKTFGTKVINPKIGKILDGLTEKSIAEGKSPSAFTNFLAKTLKLTTGMDEADTQILASNGWNKSLNDASNFNPNTVSNEAVKIANKVKEEWKVLGENIAKGEDELLSKVGGSRLIDSSEVASTLVSDLQKINVIDNNGFLNKDTTHQTTYFKKLLNQLGVVIDKDGFIDPDKFNKAGMTVSKAIKLKRDFGASIDSALKTDTEKAVAKRVFGLLPEEGMEGGLQKQVNAVAQKVKANRYTIANSSYSSFANTIEALGKQAGMQVDNPTSIANFLSSLGSKDNTQITLLRKLEQHLGTEFVDKSRVWEAVQTMQTKNPNFLRLGMVAGLAGAGFGGGTPEDRAIRAGVGFSLATPSGLKFLLTKGENVSNLAKFAGNKIGKQAVGEPVQKLLRALLSEKLRKNAVDNKNSSKYNNTGKK